MSSAKPPQEKEPAGLHSTRQMLDELDALMDRMLALPVNDLDDATLPRDVVRVPTMSATLTVLDPLEQEAEAPAPAKAPLPRQIVPNGGYTADRDMDSNSVASRDVQSRPRPAVMEMSFLEQLPRQRPTPDAAPFPEEVIPPSIAALPEPAVVPDSTSKAPRLPRRSLASRSVLPLLWFNQAFDVATYILGPPGRWLRGPGGRHLLGLTGLGMLALTGLWLVKDWLSWTW